MYDKNKLILIKIKITSLKFKHNDVEIVRYTLSELLKLQIILHLKKH